MGASCLGRQGLPGAVVPAGPASPVPQTQPVDGGAVSPDRRAQQRRRDHAGAGRGGAAQLSDRGRAAVGGGDGGVSAAQPAAEGLTRVSLCLAASPPSVLRKSLSTSAPTSD